MPPTDRFTPLVRDWFAGRFPEGPTEPQQGGWPAIGAGRDTLIAAPTGSGKTLAAFLQAIDALVAEGLERGLPDETRVVYVSPLKALGNDVQKNLDGPLAELRALAEQRGTPLPEIRTAVRTGDTLQRDRARIARKPPHVLVTTPESLYLMLTSDSGRKTLSTARTVIVDEIHAVARDKRGEHLALSLERLDRLVLQAGGARPQRIGLSATQRPIEEIARFLVGASRVGGDGVPDCEIVDGGHLRELDVAVEVPRDVLGAVASKELWAEVHDRIAELAREHRTTLVFVDTRRMAERLCHALGSRLGHELVAAHHGSLSRSIRLAAEERLKTGQIRVCVATASLELGIDVGHVDLVVLIGAPRSFAVGLQRIGRAGHWRGAIPKARLFPTTRDELQNVAAFLRGLRQRRLEETRIPVNARDVLAQQIVAMAGCEELGEDELFALVRGAWPYATLPRETFDAVVAMLAEGVATRRGRGSAWLHRDGVHRRVKGRRGARLAAITSGGAIPDNADYAVVAEPEDVPVGTINEDFAIESMAGDVFLLGNMSWRIRRVEPGKVRVEDAQGASPTIPFWLGEAPGRSRELSDEVSRLRADVEPLLGDRAETERWLMIECGLSVAAARQLAAYLAAGKASLGVMPTADVLVAERFFDEAGGMQLVIHAPFGQRVNRAFGMALRKRFCRSFDFELQAAASDDAVLLSLGPQHSFPLDTIFGFVHPGEAVEVLVQAALQSPMFGTRWRWNATRALAILRAQGGRKTPPPILRMRSDDLLSAVFPAQTACQDNAGGGPIEVPDHPLCHETIEDCLYDAMDTRGLLEVLERIADGRIRCVAVDTREASPLCHETVNGRPYTFLDDAPLEERRARAVVLRRVQPDDEGLGVLDPEAIAAVREDARPDPRDADELHDVLLGLIGLPDAEVAEGWRAWLQELAGSRRVGRIFPAGVWVAAERASTALAVWPGTLDLRPVGEAAAEPEVAAVRGWMDVCGPVTVAGLAGRLGLGPYVVEGALAQLELEGHVLRGRFSPSAVDEEWCERRLLARVHRATIGRLRREIAPVSPADLVRFLARWQRASQGAQAHGEEGLAEVIGQLQGLQVAAAAWEEEVLPTRVAGYDPRWLDALCATGVVAWGRLAVEPAGEADAARPRAAPTRSAPVALVLRDDLPWLLAATAGPTEPLSPSAEALLAVLGRRGASFFGELVAATGRAPADVEQALWDLVAAGRVTCDGFAGLRALIDGRSDGRGPSARSAGGRWSILRPSAGDPAVPVPEHSGSGGGPADVTERVARQLLRRWGVLMRDVLVRETKAPPWRDLVPVLRRLEARGEIRGGRFVNGFAGEQFALPSAVEILRAVRRTEPRGEERLEVCGADPLNLVGILTPGARIPSIRTQRARYVDGVPADATAARGVA